LGYPFNLISLNYFEIDRLSDGRN